MKKLSSSDRSALIRLASSLTAQSPMRKAILAGLKKASTEEGDGELSRPLTIDGKKFTNYRFEIDAKSIYIELTNDSGDTVFAEKKEDLSDEEFLVAAVGDVESSLMEGKLPDGFHLSDF